MTLGLAECHFHYRQESFRDSQSLSYMRWRMIEQCASLDLRVSGRWRLSLD